MKVTIKNLFIDEKRSQHHIKSITKLMIFYETELYCKNESGQLNRLLSI